MTKLLEAKETEWTKRLDAEREKSAGLAKDLATVRAELADRVTAEASAGTEVAQMTKLLEAKETEWTKRLDAERESWLLSRSLAISTNDKALEAKHNRLNEDEKRLDAYESRVVDLGSNTSSLLKLPQVRK